ncbi:MAG TPA: nucleotidyltransferase domain-containing protein [Polyangiaceae bacterium]|jgi:predicted nucleotidyltransferase
MLSYEAERLVETLRDALRGRGDVRLALLFGSLARREGTAHSDIDIAVYAPGGDLLELAAELSRHVDRELQLISLDDPGVPLLEELLRDGVIIHEGAPGQASAWRARTLSILETDRPWYARMRDAWLRRVAERGLLDGQS